MMVKTGLPALAELADGDLERRDSAVAGRAHHCLVQIALREGERRARAFQLGLDRLGARDPLARLGGLQPRLLQRHLRGALGGARLIDLLGGHETALEQWLYSRQRAYGERSLSLGRVDGARGRVGPGSLRRDLVGGNGERRFQPADCSACLVHAQFVGVWVDPEQHLAFLDLLVVAHIELDDAAADIRGHMDDIGLEVGIVRARSLLNAAGYEHAGHEHTAQRDEADQDAERLTERGHRSMSKPEQPDEQRGRHSEAGIGQQGDDDVFVNAGQHENLTDDDGGEDADSCAQHPGREVGPEQIHCRRVTAPGHRQGDRHLP